MSAGGRGWHGVLHWKNKRYRTKFYHKEEDAARALDRCGGGGSRWGPWEA